MNERIKLLAEQAGAVKVWEWASDDVLDTKSMDAEKFAELIVRECQTVVEWAINVDSTIDRVPVLIKEHFGVEE
jgi:predicted nucleotidyltransferase